jgi:hypothetical protein
VTSDKGFEKIEIYFISNKLQKFSSANCVQNTMSRRPEWTENEISLISEFTELVTHDYGYM